VSDPVVLVDDPAPMVRRITLNRPEKRNALNAALRHEIVAALREADRDPEVRVTIIRGAGSCFSAGYDLGGGAADADTGDWATAGEGQFQREVIAAWTGIWDLAKPVVAQVHGYCLAGGSELVAGCDVVYAADDAQIGYPAVRFAVPDMQYHTWLVGLRKSMELVLTGDSMSGAEAVACGYATRSFSADELEASTLAMASRIAQIPTDLAQLNKRSVHQAMEVMGTRDALKAGIPLTVASTRTETFKRFMADLAGGLSQAFKKRDAVYRDPPPSTSP
jgi:enoyl-CoA hydratase